MAVLAPLLIGPVADLIKNVLNKFAGDKMSEQEKAALTMEAQKMVFEQDWTPLAKEFEDRANARALAAADVSRGNWVSNLLAASVRPAYGYWSLGILSVLVMGKTVNLIEPTPEIMDLVKDVVKTVIFFFFGGRTIEKVTGLVTGRGKPDKD
jgi:hypothetical protein